MAGEEVGSILHIARTCFLDFSIYTPPYLLERVVSSVGCHMANLMNRQSIQSGGPGMVKFGKPRDFREHVALIVPSGFGKSTYIRTLFDAQSGLFAHLDMFPVTRRDTFSRESWMGTHGKDAQGQPALLPGLVQRYSNGIISADEYARLMFLFSEQGMENDEVILLTALDNDTVYKDLSTGTISVSDVCLTMIAGLRPPLETVSMSSGMARRFALELFLPDHSDASVFRHMSRNTHISQQPLSYYQDLIAQVVQDLWDQFNAQFPTQLNFHSVDKWCDSRDIPHFEEDLYRRLSLGYSVVTGRFPQIELDQTLETLFQNEMQTRHLIRNGIWPEAVHRIVRSYSHHRNLTAKVKGREYALCPSREVESFLDRYYCLERSKVREILAEARLGGLRQDTVQGKKVYMVPL